MKRAFAVLGFSLAVSLLVLNLISLKYIFILLIGLAALLVASLLIDRYRNALVIPLSLGASLLACVLMIFNMYAVAQPQLALDDKGSEIVFYATEKPKLMTNGNYSFSARLKEVKLQNAPQNINAYVYADTDLAIEPYVLYSANGYFMKNSNSAFASKGEWADKVFLDVKATKVKCENTKIVNLNSLLLDARENIKQFYLNHMTGDEAALSIALVTGDKSYMSYETKDAFRRAGASHIMAVSGLHLSVAMAGVMLVLKRLKFGDKAIGIIGIIVSLGYMALAGFTGSITRAGIMYIILSLGLTFGRRADALNSLGVAVFVMCINPFAVCDIGAMLSVVAVLSLICVYPYLTIKYRIVDPLEPTIKERVAKKAVDWLSGFYVSVSVSACTLPIMYAFFGYVCIVAPITSLVVVPLGSFSLAFSLMGLTTLAGYMNFTILKCVKYFASFSGSIIGMSSLSHFGLALSGAIALIGIAIAIDKGLVKRAIALSLVIFIGVGVTDYCVSQNNAYAYFTTNGAYVLKYEGVSVVGDVDEYEDYYLTKSFLMSNNLDIDYLVINDNGSYYSTLLASEIGASTIISKTLDSNILSLKSSKSIIEYNKFYLPLAEDFKMYYNFGYTSYYINGITLSLGGSEGDIILSNDIVNDKYGTIALSKGEVLYTINNENTFNSRRIDSWQD